MGDDVTQFADVKFAGGRYERPGLPLSSSAELERYERIIVEVAKELWRAANPNRQRLPRAFADGLDLRLREIRPGSVVPVLERSADALGLGVDDYFDQARDRVDDEFRKIVNGSWEDIDLPPRAQGALKRFGTSLQAGEIFVLDASSHSPITYSRSIRQRYLSHVSGDVVPVDGSMIVIVRAVDADGSFSLDTPLQSGRVPGTFTDAALFEVFKAALHDDNDTFHRLTGTLNVNEASDVVSVADVAELEIFVEAEDTGAPRLIELAALSQDWDGEGAPAIDLTVLELVRDLLNELREAGHTQLPNLYPTHEGGVQLEWHHPDRHVEIEVFPDMRVEGIAIGGGLDLPLQGTVADARAFITEVVQ